jgi:hypothetical protein
MQAMFKILELRSLANLGRSEESGGDLPKIKK